jgi:ElaA protein
LPQADEQSSDAVERAIQVRCRMRWELRTFEALTVAELYAILKLRQEVFVVEQKCAYADADGLDVAAMHLFAVDGVEVVASARLFAPGVRRDEAVIGRVVTAPAVRKSGLGRELMTRATGAIEERHGRVAIWLGAQKYLERFYASFGFVRDGDDYDEDGIPHLPMRRSEDRTQTRV